MDLSLFHIFTRGGRNYLINADRMTVIEIDEGVKRLLMDLRGKPPQALSDIERDRAGQLKLIQPAAGKKSEASRVKPPPVTGIALIITQHCNFRCVYCYETDEPGHGESDMTEKTAFRAVDWLIENSGDAKNLSLIFFGGEPLLKFDLLKKTVAYANKRGKERSKSFRFFFSSNGSLLTGKVIDFAASHNIGVQISMDGPRDIQNATRPFSNGMGSYDIVVSRVRQAIQSGRIETSCRATITNGNNPGLVRDELRKIGFTRIKMQFATPEPQGETGNGLESPERDWSGMASMAEKDASDLLDLVKGRNTSKLKGMWHTFSIYEDLERFIRPRKKGFFCDAGRSSLAVTPEGEVSLCHRFAYDQRFRWGSIFDNNFYGPSYIQKQTETQTVCRECFARHFCGGGCYHDNLALSGSTKIPARDQCRLVRQQVECAGHTAACLSEADIRYLEKQELIPPKPWYEDLW